MAWRFRKLGQFRGREILRQRMGGADQPQVPFGLSLWGTAGSSGITGSGVTTGASPGNRISSVGTVMSSIGTVSSSIGTVVTGVSPPGRISPGRIAADDFPSRKPPPKSSRASRTDSTGDRRRWCLPRRDADTGWRATSYTCSGIGAFLRKIAEYSPCEKLLW